MDFRARHLALATPLLTLALAGCGAVGAPRPPSLQIPQRVTDLSAVQRGDTIFITFTAPSLATDGAPVRKFDEVDLRAGPPDAADWEPRATRMDAVAEKPGPVRVELAARQWAGRDVIVRVRLAGRKGRFGEWSNAVRLKAVPPLEPPSGVRVEAVADGVRLDWKANAGAAYHVYRRTAKQEQPALIGTAEKEQFTDMTAAFGTQYQYYVEAFTKAGDAEAFSKPSETVEITPEDRFPPAVPAGLIATAGVGVVQVTWNPSEEQDLAGYRVYRSAAGAEFQRVADAVATPFYADHDVKAGVSYRYAVSAFDQGGNESARTNPAEATAQ